MINALFWGTTVCLWWAAGTEWLHAIFNKQFVVEAEGTRSACICSRDLSLVTTCAEMLHGCPRSTHTVHVWN